MANHRQILADESIPVPRVVTPCEVVVSLEGTGRWPEDPEAYYKMKSALLLQLATKLKETHGYESLASEDAVDVFVDGFAFRLMFQIDRDDLVRNVIEIRKRGARTLAEQMGVQHVDHDVMPAHLRIPDEAAYTPLRHLARVGLPDAMWLHGGVAAVGGMYGAFSLAVRLFKRWVSASHLSFHLSEEACELLAAHVFVSSGCLEPPGSALAGLARCLALVATWPFDKRPLAIDLPASALTDAQRREAMRMYRERRDAGQHLPALYLITTRDLESKLWTHHHPSREAMHRAQALAQKAVTQLRAAVLLGKKSGEAESVFDPARSLVDCDIVVSLRKEALPYGDRVKSSAAASSSNEPLWFASKADGLPVDVRPSARAVLRHIPRNLLQSRGVQRLRGELLIGFEPLRMFVEALQDRVGHVAIPWVDADLGSHIGLSFIRKSFVAAPLRPAFAHLYTAANDKSEEAEQPVVVPDATAILDEVLACGEGLLDTVHVKGI